MNPLNLWLCRPVVQVARAAKRIIYRPHAHRAIAPHPIGHRRIAHRVTRAAGHLATGKTAKTVWFCAAVGGLGGLGAGSLWPSGGGLGSWPAAGAPGAESSVGITGGSVFGAVGSAEQGDVVIVGLPGPESTLFVPKTGLFPNQFAPEVPVVPSVSAGIGGERSPSPAPVPEPNSLITLITTLGAMGAVLCGLRRLGRT